MPTVTFCLPDLMRAWSASRWTGTVRVEGVTPRDDRTTLLVENGTIVFAHTRQRTDPTGDLFIELLDVGGYGRDAVDEVLRVRGLVVRALTELLLTETAVVSTNEGIALSRWPRAGLRTADLLLLSLRDFHDAKRLRAWIGSLDRPLRTIGDPFTAFEIEPTAEEAYVLTRFSVAPTLAELLALDAVPEIVTLHVVCALSYAGVVTTSIDEVNDAATAARFWEAIEAKLEAVRSGADFYTVLEVDRRAPAAAITASYRRLVSLFVRGELCSLAPCQHTAAKNLESLALALDAAHVTLSSSELRAIYDRHAHSVFTRERAPRV